jgi:2-hydroxy-3-keto-5-methylthiopentenyl-1-phosphate phosphatase
MNEHEFNERRSILLSLATDYLFSKARREEKEAENPGEGLIELINDIAKSQRSFQNFEEFSKIKEELEEYINAH